MSVSDEIRDTFLRAWFDNPEWPCGSGMANSIVEECEKAADKAINAVTPMIRAAALEEAAKVADAEARAASLVMESPPSVENDFRYIAAAIRALIAKEGT